MKHLNRFFSVLLLGTVLISSCGSRGKRINNTCQIKKDENHISYVLDILKPKTGPGQILGDITTGTISSDDDDDSNNPGCFHLSIEYVLSGLNVESQKKTNAAIASLVSRNYTEYYYPEESYETDKTSILGVAERIIYDYSTLQNDATNENEDVGTNLGHRIEMDGTFIWFSNHYVSYQLSSVFSDNSIFARPWHYDRYMTIELKSGEQTKITDIFKKDKLAEVSRMLARQLDNQLEEPHISYESLQPSLNFALTKEGILFCYDTGEIESNALGVIVVILTWENVQPYLTQPIRKYM